MLFDFSWLMALLLVCEIVVDYDGNWSYWPRSYSVENMDI